MTTAPRQTTSLVKLRATMADIAREAGVARSTASAILGGQSYCYASQAVRERVHEAARRLGYQPNYLAMGLAGKPTHSIGLIMSHIRGPMVNLAMLHELEQAAWRRGYRFMIGSSLGKPHRQYEYIRHYVNQRVDGLIVPNVYPENIPLLDELVADGVPVVTIDAPAPCRAWNVTFERRHAGYLQVRHLLELGRRNLCFLVSSGHSYMTREKIVGYERALDETAGARDLATFVYAPRWPREEHPRRGVDLMQAALEMGRPFDAVVSMSDIHAMGVMQVLLRSGRRIPEDVAVVGLGDLVIAGYLPVPLTTVQQTGEAGRVAFELLYELITRKGDRSIPPRQVTLPARLIVRESTVGTAGPVDGVLE